MKKHQEIKKRAYQHCKEFVDGRISRLHEQIRELETALTSETKSSAGDKHETGRAMVQLEREKLGTQLAENEKMRESMHRVRPDAHHTIGSTGALVETTDHYYYIAISAGEVKWNGFSIFCISPATPIGKLLLGLSAGDTFSFNGKAYLVLSIS